MARQALDGRSNRAGTLGVTPGATSRDESAHWSPVISSERQSVRVKGGGKRSSINKDGMSEVERSITSMTDSITPEHLEKWWCKVFLLECSSSVMMSSSGILDSWLCWHSSFIHDMTAVFWCFYCRIPSTSTQITQFKDRGSFDKFYDFCLQQSKGPLHHASK